ncbi:hypothetical protein I7I50_09129 [Histoplasma capsulatum G186AR]|uniref:Uncharacterized protein n=1 Tax=Ajellomyces capsulatus TaxID=5037 RepID=A0A8H7YU00_AJECA|nr:hypothetical protein I7I52_06648 [Histoplasma capsulatum]QSS74093.1 hypothetical protein I7I50_09129 [Histoplasma capsulatum G186AR]
MAGPTVNQNDHMQSTGRVLRTGCDFVPSSEAVNNTKHLMTSTVLVLWIKQQSRYVYIDR